MRRRRRPTLHHAVKDKRVTVLGPVKQPEMDFMSHRGGAFQTPPPPPLSEPPPSPLSDWAEFCSVPSAQSSQAHMTAHMALRPIHVPLGRCHHMP